MSLTTRICANPRCDNPNPAVHAGGYCSRCYYRLRRNGRLDRVNAFNMGPCSFPGCKEEAHCKGLCQTHYRLQRHPLNETWRLTRSRAFQQVPEEWKTFDGFLASVGDRPGDGYQFRKKNHNLPWALDNWVWLPPLKTPENMADKRIYMRAWALRRRYNLSQEDVDRMVVEQNECCPICLRSLFRISPKTGKPIKVCVDHDHYTGANRAILDDACNLALGMMQDDAERVDRMAAYLRSHQEEPND
jgi:hypothetical protein